MDDSTYQPPFIEGRRRKNTKKPLIISSIVVFVLIAAGIGGMQLLGSTASSSPTPSPSPTLIQFPTDTPTPTASPTAALNPTPTTIVKQSPIDSKTKLDRSKLRILVENGSGVVGAANKIAQSLKAAGYTVVGAQNADAFTYEDVTISLKSGQAAYLPLLKQDLGNEYTIGGTNTTLDASTSADALVIIGK